MTVYQKSVSSPYENLILVDSQDQQIGEMHKWDAHKGQGVLHRAFSVLLFNDQGELLLQQRAQDKPLWPLFWSNSCCSHPRVGETVEEAVYRRLDEELGVKAKALQYLYKFQYNAAFEDKGSENELCYVYVGRVSGDIRPNVTEVNACCFVSAFDLEKALKESDRKFTPWFKMEWEYLKQHHGDTLQSLNVVL